MFRADAKLPETQFITSSPTITISINNSSLSRKGDWTESLSMTCVSLLFPSDNKKKEEKKMSQVLLAERDLRFPSAREKVTGQEGGWGEWAIGQETKSLVDARARLTSFLGI